MNDLLKYREDAINWFKSGQKFDEGMSILVKSGFKPAVVNRLQKHGENGPDARNRLYHLMDQLLRAWNMTPDELEDTDTENGILNGKPIDTEDNGYIESIKTTIEKLDAKKITLPESVTSVVRQYASMYRDRSMLHRNMAALPEDNNDDTVSKRKDFSDKIKSITEKMERLYPLYEKYTTDHVEPTNDDIDSAIQEDSKQSTNPDDDEPTSDYNTMGKDELKKLKKSFATKILRANNMLQYQQQTKSDNPNPMPESPQRVKFETKISKLTAEIEKIDYALAKLV